MSDPVSNKSLPASTSETPTPISEPIPGWNGIASVLETAAAADLDQSLQPGADGSSDDTPPAIPEFFDPTLDDAATLQLFTGQSKTLQLSENQLNNILRELCTSLASASIHGTSVNAKLEEAIILLLNIPSISTLNAPAEITDEDDLPTEPWLKKNYSALHCLALANKIDLLKLRPDDIKAQNETFQAGHAHYDCNYQGSTSKKQNLLYFAARKGEINSKTLIFLLDQLLLSINDDDRAAKPFARCCGKSKKYRKNILFY